MLLQSKSRFLTCWFMGFVALSAILAFGKKSHDKLARQAANKEKNIGTTAVIETPELGSRSTFGGRYIGKLPPWEFPIHCVKEHNYLDGLFCGIGIRLDADVFLASSISMMTALKGLSDPDEPELFKDSLFNFYNQGNWSITKPEHPMWQWGFKFKKGYKHNIALYRLIRRRDTHPRFIPSLDRPPNLAMDSTDVQPCRVVTFGGDDGHKGTEIPDRYPVAIYVDKIKCNQEHLCEFGPTKNKTITRQDLFWDGFLCGVTSDLGAPVICGEGKEERLRYIVAETETPCWECMYRKCSDEFKALDVSKFAKEFLADTENIDRL